MLGQYTQCFLERQADGHGETLVAWIPTGFAVTGKRVAFDVRDDRGRVSGRDEGWVVREVYSSDREMSVGQMEDSREPFVRVLGGDASEWDRKRDCWSCFG